MNALETCELDSNGYKTCGIHIDQLFVAGKSYSILTAEPYLVTETETPNIYAFLDLGFSGTIEQSERSSHGLWKHPTLDSAIDEKLGSQILMIGLTSMKKFHNIRIDYKEKVVVFSTTMPNNAAEVRAARPFSNFESEMFAPEIMLSDLKQRRANVFTLLDTGNPSTFIMNKAFAQELSDFGVDSSCACGVAGLEKVTVQNANLTLKEHAIDVFINGQKVLDTIRGVCDVAECGSEHLNKTIRNPGVHPAVSVNLGNDALAKMEFLYIDFQKHKFFVPRAQARNRIEADEEGENDDWIFLLLKIAGGLAIVLLFLLIILKK